LSKPQITQYPAATPKAKAATMVSKSKVEEKNVVIAERCLARYTPLGLLPVPFKSGAEMALYSAELCILMISL
jgi:hypothetical protein